MTDDRWTPVEAAAFYDRLAIDYDTMTDFEKRFVMEKPFFNLLVNRYGITTALDAGSGTGFHSLLLARLGVDVTAVDVSTEMLKRLRENAAVHQLNVTTTQSDFVELDRKVTNQFDAVFCIGNTLVHLTSMNAVRKTLMNFHLLLKPQGTLFIQTLNYDRIMTLRERVQNVMERDGKTFVRFYDYVNGKILFNILSLEKQNDDIHHHLITTELRPILKDEMLDHLTDAGFEQVEVYNGIRMEKFQQDTSHDLFLIARRRS